MAQRVAVTDSTKSSPMCFKRAVLKTFFSTLEADLANLETTCPRKDYAFRRQHQRMLKRAALRKCDVNPSEVAIDAFYSANDYVGTRVLNLDSIMINDAQLFIARCLETQCSKDFPDSLQESFRHDQLLSRWRFGPGTTLWTDLFPPRVSRTHAVDKFYGQWTVTESCKPLVSFIRRNNLYLSAYDSHTVGVTEPSYVSGSKLLTVSKNQDTDRTIAIEPLGNMVVQLAAGQIISDALRGIGLDIESQQPKNKLLACSGSISGRLATIDLKWASDLIGIDLVRLLLPAKWFRLLMQIRSPITTIPSRDAQVELNMVSTMGNGFTFPLMTLILTALVYATRCHLGRQDRPCFMDWSETAVFGDDIIVPAVEASTLMCVLEQAGFLVNHQKSFCDGPFRESCGGDYYEGYNVTPFYVKTLRDRSDVYVALNQLTAWCSRHKVVLFRTFRFLLGLLDDKPFLVPEWLNPDQGWLTGSCPMKYKYLKQDRYVREVSSTIKNSDGEHETRAIWMPLICGGYVEGGKDGHLLFSPRTTRRGAKVCKARIPSGFLDGWDPLLRSQDESSFASLIVELTR